MTKYLWLVVSLMAMSQLSHAANFPARVGVCYEFEGNEAVLTTPCAISSITVQGNNAAEINYNQVKHNVSTGLADPNAEESTYISSIDNMDAELYYRETSFLSKVSEEYVENNEDILTCYRTSSLDFCHN